MSSGSRTEISSRSEPNDHKERLLTILRRQRDALQNAVAGELQTYIPQWRDRTARLLNGLLLQDEIKLFTKINTDSWTGDRSAFVRFLNDLENGVTDVPDHYLAPQALTAPPAAAAPGAPAAPTNHPLSNHVFIVHGHDTLSKVEVARTLERLKLTPIVLHEQPNEGRTIIEKFERDASKASFAVVLLTPDDEGHPIGKPSETRKRARQNVVLELGYFSGFLGRARVCVLYRGDVEVPSDYLGVLYVPLDDAGAWRFTLAKELKQAGLTVDLNDLV